ncbi:MAG: ribonuclease H-like YkuK family protein [Candidatus Bipolaricaulota bacterium]|nr:ribonuclease H-like YkuK family protein [Candidatus Bipolaricaulota bacterium]MDW8126318.1 ribonuclease H-like YkuK family protein [Candidatus Bipolaricaulota bacterium]
MDGKSANYYSPTLGRLSFPEVVNEIIAMMEASPDDVYSIVVGTDSQTYYGEAEYVTAIVVHRVGKGGRYFWRRVVERKPKTLRDRIWREAWLSYETAQALIQAFKQRGIFDCRLEIHVDIGRGGRTRELVEEVVGAIRGSGFFVRTKPEAYAASVVADKYT